MSTARPIPVHPELTAIAIKAPVPGMIADQVLPEFQVMAETFKWNEFPYAQGVSVPDTAVGRRSQTQRVEFKGIEKDGSVADHGLEDSVPVTDATANSDIDPEALAAEMVSQLVTLSREGRAAALVFNPATYLAAQRTVYDDGTSAAGWHDPDSDPLADIEAAKDAMIVEPNTLTVGLDGFRALRRHPKLIKAARSVSSTGEGRLSIDELRELLDIETILVGKAHLNIARPGQEPTIRRVWSNHASLTFTERLVKNAHAYTFGATARLGAKTARKHFDNNVGVAGGNVIRVSERLRELVIAQQAGWFFENAAAAPA